MKHFRILLIFLTFLFFQQKANSALEIDAPYVILQDHHSGEILYEKDADARIYPASMTKLLTYLKKEKPH